jgi:uncharacterized protein (DUF1684 family)
VHETLDLLDWRRRVADLYGEVRRRGTSETTWRWWRAERDELFATHPASPLPASARAAFTGLPVFPYDPALHLGQLEVHEAEPALAHIAHSGAGTTVARRIGTLALELDDVAHPVSVHWLDVYGGGVFVPVRDATNGTDTYGGGRYLLDTVKGADLGGGGTHLEVDLNFLYHPSCAHDPAWSCPLAPADEALPVRIEAGEQLGDGLAEEQVVEVAT